MNQFWKTIVPVVGEPIPGGAEFSWGNDFWFSPDTERYSNFSGNDIGLNWRVPVECVPLDVAVDAIMAGFNYSEGSRLKGLPHLSVNFAGGMVAKTQEDLRELVIAKLRQLSQESTNGTH